MTSSIANSRVRDEMKSEAQFPADLFSTQNKTQNQKIKSKTTQNYNLSSLTDNPIKSEFSEAEISAAFKVFDLDKNSYIGAKEIKHILMCMGELATDEEIDMMIHMIDVDGDCHISFIEFRKLILDPSPHLTDLHTMIKIEKKYEENEGKAISIDRYSVSSNDFNPKIGRSEEAIEVAERNRGVINVESANSIERTSTPSTQRQKDSNLRESTKKFLISFVDENNLNFEIVKNSYQAFMSFPYNRRRKNEINYPDLCLVFGVYDEVEYQKLFSLLDDKNQGEIDFKRFILSLLNFITIDREDRIKYIFHLYDESESGHISEDDLNEILMGSHIMSLSGIQNKSMTIMKKIQNDRECNDKYCNNHNNKLVQKKDSLLSVSITEFITISKKFPNVLFPSANSNP